MPCRSITCVRGPIHLAASASLPERRDLFAANGQRLDNRRGGAHRDDLAVAQDEVGGLRESRGGEREPGGEWGCTHGASITIRRTHAAVAGFPGGCALP